MWFCGIESYATAGPPGDHGRSYGFRMRNRSRPKMLAWSMGHSVVEADYYPALGLVGNAGIRDNWIDFSTYDEFSNGRMTDWHADVELWRTDHYDGSQLINGMSFYSNMSFRNGTGVWLSMSKSRREDYHDRNLSFGYSWGGRDLYKNGGVSLGLGRLANGDHFYRSVSQGWQINDRLSVNVSYEYARISEPSPEAFTGCLLITSLVYDFDNEHTAAGSWMLPRSLRTPTGRGTTRETFTIPTRIHRIYRMERTPSPYPIRTVEPLPGFAGVLDQEIQNQHSMTGTIWPFSRNSAKKRSTSR